MIRENSSKEIAAVLELNEGRRSQIHKSLREEHSSHRKYSIKTQRWKELGVSEEKVEVGRPGWLVSSKGWDTGIKGVWRCNQD